MNGKKDFPKKFPFWARLKIYKNRTTLVIDEGPALDKQKKEMVDGYVHREATHTKGHGEPITPNPDTVSYTHLDVYKRQDVLSGMRPGFYPDRSPGFFNGRASGLSLCGELSQVKGVIHIAGLTGKT